jgi:Domain of unknown function (DUF4157)
MHRSYRQAWLARNILSRQPLVIRIAKNQLLPQALGFAAGSTPIPEQESFLPEPGLYGEQRSALLLYGSVLQSPFTEMMNDELEKAAASFPPGEVLSRQVEESEGVSNLESEVATVGLQIEEVSGQQIIEDSKGSNLESEVATVSFPIEVDPDEHIVESVKTNDFEPEKAAVSYSAVEGPDQHTLQSAEGSDFEQEVATLSLLVEEQVPEQPIVLSAHANDFEPEVPPPEQIDVSQSDEFSESVRVEIQQEQESAEGFAQSRRAKPSRGRIEEAPASARFVQHSPPPPSSSMDQRDHQVTKAPQRKDTFAAKTGREERSTDELFAPRDTDRSPQAWMARLMGSQVAKPSRVASSSATSNAGQENEPAQVMGNISSEKVQFLPHSESGSAIQRLVGGVPERNNETPSERQPPIAARANETIRSTTPISQRARRFLQPLVGIDPASVHVHRDTIAEQVTDAYQADAITIANEVEIAVGHQDDTPETLGLLAHELTHVARLWEPRFIPPIARSVSAAMPTPGQALSMDEETLALSVEYRVKLAAEKQIEQETPLPIELMGGVSESPASPTNPPFVSRKESDTWGGLPAPWEPLPDWLVVATATTGDSMPMPSISAQTSRIAHNSSEIESKASQAGKGREGWNSSISGAVQRAGRERSEEIEEEQEAQTATFPQSSPTDTLKTPEMDLDMLARQVYARLKRRLEVERRRES